jgi:hypothetical protein
MDIWTNQQSQYRKNARQNVVPEPLQRSRVFASKPCPGHEARIEGGHCVLRFLVLQTTVEGVCPEDVGEFAVGVVISASLLLNIFWGL